MWQKVGVRGHHLQHQYLLFAKFTKQSANFKLSTMASTLKNEKCWTHSPEYKASHIPPISNDPPPIDCESDSVFYGDVLDSLEFGVHTPHSMYWAGLSLVLGRVEYNGRHSVSGRHQEGRVPSVTSSFCSSDPSTTTSTTTIFSTTSGLTSFLCSTFGVKIDHQVQILSWY